MKYEVLNVNDLEVDFIHLENGQNLFNARNGRKLLGISKQLYSKTLRRLKDSSGEVSTYVDFSFKDPKTNRTVEYVDFTILNIIAANVASISPKAFELCLIAGQLLNEKFNIEAGFTKSLYTEAEENLKNLKQKVWEYTVLAFENTNNTKLYLEYMNEADKQQLDYAKRKRQLDNERNCRRRMAEEIRLNKKGILTESCEDEIVLLPYRQAKLPEFKGV